MAFSLNQLSTANAFTAANTLENLPPCTKARLTVFNAGVIFSLKLASQAGGLVASGAWEPESYAPPGVLAMVRASIVGIRVRSAVAGAPAVFSVELTAAGDA